jgi:AraC-like DNA-binding protein
MIFDFTPDRDFNFLDAFAQRVGVERQGDTVALPDWLGTGSMQVTRLATGFTLLTHHYTLHEELILRRTAATLPADQINVLFPMDTGNDWQTAPSTTALRDLALIRITSPDMIAPTGQSDLSFPVHSPIYFALLSMNRPALRNLLNLHTLNGAVAQVLMGGQAFLFSENLTSDAQRIIRRLSAVDTQQGLGTFRVWIQVQELIGWLFERLLARETLKHRPIHQADAEQLERVRRTVTADLSVPPQLPQLARLAGMSVSKLTDLYKQVFGDSIYEYFQKARLEQAGVLLRQRGVSVSEVGYQLGFSNLSHFSRLFQKHYGITPKRFITNYSD